MMKKSETERLRHEGGDSSDAVLKDLNNDPTKLR